METGSSTGLPSQPCIPLVSLDLQGASGVPVVTGMTHLLGVLQVPLFLLAARVAMAMMAGLFRSILGDEVDDA
jgi:hypothetical protein